MTPEERHLVQLEIEMVRMRKILDRLERRLDLLESVI